MALQGEKKKMKYHIEDSRLERKQILEEYILKKRFKSTKQRDVIFNEFFSLPKHVTVEELYERVKSKDPRIGYATVYRTLKLFKDCGLAFERNFGDGSTRYEPVLFEGEHHDHIICMECNRIMEFRSPEIEDYIRKIAGQYNFRLRNHKLELYGTCSDCTGGKGK